MGDGSTTRSAITRREALRDLGLAGLGASAVGSGIDALLASAASAAPKAGALKDIEHVVFLIQENRSFDHYFGTLSGVRGFGDRKGRKAFTQLDTGGKKRQPFHLTQNCFQDLTHNWAPQHRAYAHGRMDKFVLVHEEVDGIPEGPETMGYYRRSDLPFYHALADAFTICDGYYCSVLGPTDPNRLMSMSATIDPAGTHGGPLLETRVSGRTNRFSWHTMPESLESRHVSWKVYTSPSGGSFDNVLTYFKQYTPGSTLHARGIDPTYPNDFMADLDNNQLPQVSWLLTGLGDTEHPGFSTAIAGEAAARRIVEALMAKPEVWKRTALFITWDENGGFFDHVAPPTPAAGTPGEYLTVSPLPSAAEGVQGPIGLGFRVPMLIVSPFSRGGLVCSDVFDHTSMLRFLETRFGVQVPNLSRWRRGVTGDLTSAFNFAATPSAARPRLPQAGTAHTPCQSPVPPARVSSEGIPRQERGTRRRPSGVVRPKRSHR